MIDIDFQTLMESSRIDPAKAYPHVPLNYAKIFVSVRKRPLFHKESSSGQIDCVSVANPVIRVGEPKYKVDGITKYIENHDHRFDNVYGDKDDNEEMYRSCLQPMLDKLFNDGVVTIFAYGQTGSGKTYTMVALQNLAINDIFELAENDYSDLDPQVSLSFYEIYSGRILDLLNKKKRLQVLEDGANKIQVKGLQEIGVESVDELKEAIQYAHSVRTTHATQANDTSSRSHAICCINVRDGNGSILGKFLMVDLAGSERAQDIRSNNRERRAEGAEINKSLLALKECIRALDNAKGNKEAHVPFRASKLTMVLRDSFMGTKKNICIGMIACVSPGYSHADHSLNTIRYAERLKEFPNESDYKKLVKDSGGKMPSTVKKPKAKAKDVKAKKKQEKPPKGNKMVTRAKWGKIDREYVDEAKVEETNEDDDNEEEQANLMRTKKGELEDWKLLKQTLRSGGEDDIMGLDLQEKADMLLEKKEDIISKHMKYIRQVALMLKQEGELITQVQQPD
jgi:kinesin family protein 2/24